MMPKSSKYGLHTAMENLTVLISRLLSMLVVEMTSSMVPMPMMSSREEPETTLSMAMLAMTGSSVALETIP